MALLNAAALKKLPDSAFAYIDSDGDRHLPVPDAEHVRAAMARFNQTQFESDSKKTAAHGKILAAAKKFGIDVANFSKDDTKEGKSMLAKALSDLMDSVLPSTKKTESVSMTADFSGTPATVSDGMVIRTGKIFEIGEYPDRAFSFDEDDLEQAVASFEPCPVDLEHIPTVLQGKLGQVARIFPGEDGKSLMGDVALPQWLDQLLEDGERKVSATWDRASKTLAGLALVRSPRVSDAALMAAFAGTRHDTPSGQMAIQRIHDAAVMGGAVCKRVGMSSRHESSAIQQMHDTAVSHGATCETNGTMTSPLFSSPRSTRMNLREFLTGKAQEDGIELDEAELTAAFAGAPPPPAAEATTSPEATELASKLAARDAEIEALKKSQEAHSVAFAQAAQERREAQSAAFTQAQVSSHRLTPAAAEKLQPIVSRILATDETVMFADGESSTMTLLTAFAESLPDLAIFTTDTIKRDEVAALFTTTKTEGIDGDDPTKPNPETVRRMREATTEGRAILKEQAASK